MTKEIEILKKDQTEILELNNLINEKKNALKCIGNRADYMENRISEVEDSNPKTIGGKERELRFLKSIETLQEPSDSIIKTHIGIMGIPKGEERRKKVERLFK